MNTTNIKIRRAAIVAILLPQLIMSPFWFIKAFEMSDGLALCQMIYGCLVAPLMIGIYGIWEIANRKTPMLKTVIFCVLLVALAIFAGYANWGLSTGYFLDPDAETIQLVILEGKVAAITFALLVTPAWVMTRMRKSLTNGSTADRD